MTDHEPQSSYHSTATLNRYGDLVIADASEDYVGIGKTIELLNLENEKILAGLHTLLARLISDQIYVGFSAYMMDCWFVRQQIMKIAQGTKVLGISMGRLCKVQVPLPSREEQQKIASFLSSIDTRIEQLEKKKSLFKQYKKGLLQTLFSQEIRFKSEHGNEYPDWEESKLGNIVDVYDGTHQTPQYVKEGVPFFSVENVTADNFDDTKFISEESFRRERTRIILKKGDILMTRIGSVGVAKYIDWDVRASIYVSLALLKISSEKNGRFFAQYISHQNFQRELWKRTIHAAFPKKVNLGEIGNCLVQFPNEEEQQKIASFLSSIDRKIELISDKIEKAREFKKGLFQQMFV